MNKIDFVRRYKRGEFGNAAPTWNTFEEYSNSGHQGLVHFRNRIANGPTWYNVTQEQSRRVWDRVTTSIRPDTLYISAMAPTEKTVFQGEVQRGLWGLDLYYSCLPKTMREALAEDGHDTKGIVAKVMVEQFLDMRSQDWLRHLLDTYSDHVVEFSAYSVEWGTVSGYNTVFWEVRKY